MTLHYRFVTYLIYLYLKIFRRLSIQGTKNIPADEAVIFAPNHTSNMDPFVVAASTDKAMGYFAKKELFFFPLGQLIGAFGAFPVNRQGNATSAVRTAIFILERGMSLTIFPEGTRNKTTALLLPAKRGVSLIAKKTQTPVIPVAIQGSRGFFSKISIEFGKPIRSHLNQNTLPAKTKQDPLIEELMEDIARMLTRS